MLSDKSFSAVPVEERSGVANTREMNASWRRTTERMGSTQKSGWKETELVCSIAATLHWSTPDSLH